MIENVNVIDVRTGNVRTNFDVLIIKDSIAQIQEHKKGTFNAAKKIDGTDKYLLPGLWDMHSHWIDTYEYFFPMMLANGVVGIRDMWGNLPVLSEVRHKITDGELIGPDIFSAGFLVAGANPIQAGASDIAATPEEGRAIVRSQKSDGADFIKVYSELEREVYLAIADECQNLGIPMVGHLPSKVSLEDAIAANHLSIEHTYGINAFLHKRYIEARNSMNNQPNTLQLDEPVKSYYATFGIGALEYDIDNLDATRIPKLIELLSNSNTWITPTMVVEKGYQRQYDSNYDPSLLNSYMPDYVIDGFYVKDTLKTSRDSINYNWNKKNYEFLIKLLEPMFDGNVKILAGTDHVVRFSYPGFSLHDELQIFVEEAGATPLQALQTATINPTIFLGIEEIIGTVEEGKRASLILLNCNPLKDIKNTKNIDGLILRGIYYPKEELNNKLSNLIEYNRKPQIRMVLDSLITKCGIDVAINEYHKLKKKNADKYNFGQRQLITLGNNLLDKDEITDALKIFELNTQIYPKLSHSFVGLGDAYFKLGKYELASNAWQKANELGGYTTHTRIAKLKSK